MTPLSKDKGLLACLLLVFVCRAMIVAAVVPPWQAPDEPTHFAAAQYLALPSGLVAGSTIFFDRHRGVYVDRAEANLQGQILESMRTHRWWESRGATAPDPLPWSFGAVADGRWLPAASYSQPLYYGLAALVLRTLPATSVDAAYQHMRVLGVILALFTLVFAWMGTKLLFGPAVALGSVAVAALLPQVLLTAIAAHPDGLVNFFGAFIWWQVARVIRERRRALSLATVVVSAFAVLLIKRSAVPLSAASMLLVALLLIRIGLPRTRHQRNLWLTGVGLVAVMIVMAAYAGLSTRIIDLWNNTFITRRPSELVTIAQALEYLRIAIDYIWLMAGWQRYAPPEPWLWIARLMTVAGVAGAIICVARPPRGERLPLLVTWSFVLIQGAAIVGPGFFSLAAPQGRYFFAVLAPMTTLLWLGLLHLVPQTWRIVVGQGIVAVLVLLDVTGVATVLVPAYIPAIFRVQ